MSWTFWLTELLIYGFAILIVRHAWRGGAKWISTFAAASICGFALEYVSVMASETYCYGEFLVMLPPWGGEVPQPGPCPLPDKVPLWIMLGWGLTVYVAMRTSTRLSIPWYTRPVVDAILATNVDWIMDPLAAALGFWNWSSEGPWFGVPLNNYFGWIVTVGSFSFVVRLLWHLVPEGRSPRLRNVALPFAAAVAAPFAVFGLMTAYKAVAGAGVNEWWLVAGTVAAVVVVIALVARQVRRERSPDYALIGIAVFFQVYYTLLLWVTGTFAEHPALVPIALVTIVVAVFGYSWPYRLKGGTSPADDA